MFTQSAQPTIGYMDLFKQRKEFFADLASVSSKFESVARNWTPLLPLIKNFIIYSTNQFSVLSDPDNPDPGWKEFSKEALTAIDKLQPIFDELAKSKSHLPQMFGYFIDLIKQIPRLIVYFDKLQLHIPLLEMIPQGEELKTDFPHLVMSRLRKNLPQYETIKKFLEENYQKFTELNGLEIFSKRTYAEKISFLTAMGGFNNALKQLFLALDRVAIQLGIRVDDLLSAPIFMQRQLSVEQLCKQFSKFYIEALKEAGFDLSEKKSLYPFHDEIILQQKTMLQELQDKSKLQERIDALYDRTIINMKDQTEKTLAIIENTDAETLRHKLYLQGLLKTLNTFKKKEDLIAIVNALEQNAEREAFKSKKNAKFIVAITSIFTEMKTSIARMHEKEKNARLSLEMRIQKLAAKREITDEIKEESKLEVAAEADTTFIQLKAILTEILEQFKKISATLESRPKKIEEISEPLSEQSQVEKILTLLYGQLEVMLDKNIYQQYILGNEALASVDLHGAGWIVTVGAALNKVKLAFDKYKAIAVYFKSEKPEDTKAISPRNELLVFLGKTQEMAEISQELIASLVALEKDPFVQSLLSSAGLKNIVYLHPPIEVEDEKASEEYKIDIELPDSVEKFLDTLAKIYETSAQQHLHDKDKVKAMRETLFRIYKLTNEYQDFKKLDKNKIQVSKIQMYAFVWRHFKDIFLLLGDVPGNLSDVMVVSKKEFSLLIRDLNFGLRDLILLLNRIEIEFNFKQGYFTNHCLPDLFSIQLQETLKLSELPETIKTSSLQDVIGGIYKKLEDLGYTFSVKFPFFSEIQHQQLKILFKAERSTLKNRYAYYFVRQTLAKEIHQKHDDLMVSETNSKHSADAINALIEANINQLQAQRGANKVILTSLLRKLTQLDTAVETLDVKLNTLSQNAYDRENIYLLYQRHTRKLMTDLHQQTATRTDILNDIDDEIDKLSEKRARHYFFYAKSRRIKLEATIFAYQELRQFMQHPGHKVTDFASESPQQYTLLVEHDKSMLEKLLRFSEQSIYLKNEKLVAGDVLPHPEPVLTQAKSMILKLKHASIISTRITELRSQCMFSTPRKKIKLLETLQKHLETTSLEKSLIAMRNDKASQADFYLLHDGKTGQMLKEITQLAFTKKDMQNAISLEIFRLKKLRHEVFYFSQKSRKLLLEERIQACLAFHQAVENSEESAWDTLCTAALHSLSDKDKMILKKFEAKLIDKLRDWEDSNWRLDKVVMPRKI